DVFEVQGGLYSQQAFITDFATGAGGDLMNVNYMLGVSNVHGDEAFAQGYLLLQPSGSDTDLLWDRDGSAGSTYAPVTAVTLQNVLPSSITSDNFVGRLIV